MQGENHEDHGFKSHPRRFPTNPLHSHTLGEILSFGLWMNKQDYRHSTVHYCIQALKSIARGMLGGERIETGRVESCLTNVACEKSTDQGRESLGEAAQESGVTLLHYYYPLSSFRIPLFPYSLNLCVRRILSTRLSCFDWCSLSGSVPMSSLSGAGRRLCAKRASQSRKSHLVRVHTVMERFTMSTPS